MILVESYSKTVDDLIYLISCSVNQISPDAKRVDEMDLKEIYLLSENHSVGALIAFALETVIEPPKEFDQTKKKALRKLALFDIERKKIFDNFDREKIWYLPLKGSILKDYYPKYGMREMSDNDVLCDASRMANIKTIMENLGFECESYAEWITDNYVKKPLVFEFHKSLFEAHETKVFHNYYLNIKNKLLRVSEDRCEYRFSLEDFYIYLLAHEYKHYVYGGTGLRSLIDIYVFLRRWEEKMNWEYISNELSKLGMSDFEQKNRSLSQKLFSYEVLSDSEKDSVLFFINSGTYGSFEYQEDDIISMNLAGNDSKGSKRKYIIGRLFVSAEDIKSSHPFVYKHRSLMPLLHIYRIGKACISKPKSIFSEYKSIKRFKY